jgi:hypothetical protein
LEETEPDAGGDHHWVKDLANAEALYSFTGGKSGKAAELTKPDTY